MRRRQFLQTASAAALTACAGSSPEPQRPPNVVFVLTDDQAPRSLGVYGNPEIQTPHCDRLAGEGALLNNAFCTTPVCSPSRMTLMTGQIPSQHGVHDWISDGNEGDQAKQYLAGEATFTQVLADNGYRCGLSGKWHMGDSPTPQAGFDYWFAMPTGGSRYQDPEMYWEGEKKVYPGYATDVITDKALEFIDASKDNPFFCFVSYNVTGVANLDDPCGRAQGSQPNSNTADPARLVTRRIAAGFDVQHQCDLRVQAALGVDHRTHGVGVSQPPGERRCR